MATAGCARAASAGHVSAILRKLPVRTRTEASSEAVRLGLAAREP
jgi:DNA-binding CsgD family transcriptional regulator